jgi:hypothetical protein
MMCSSFVISNKIPRSCFLLDDFGGLFSGNYHNLLWKPLAEGSYAAALPKSIVIASEQCVAAWTLEEVMEFGVLCIEQQRWNVMF